MTNAHADATAFSIYSVIMPSLMQLIAGGLAEIR